MQFKPMLLKGQLYQEEIQVTGDCISGKESLKSHIHACILKVPTQESHESLLFHYTGNNSTIGPEGEPQIFREKQ